MTKVLTIELFDCGICPWFYYGWAAVSGLTEEKSRCCHPNFENKTSKSRQRDRVGRGMSSSRVPDTIPEFCPLPEKEPI